ncbi:hypothetical protein FO519_008846 [Halicephalobus sp. NKZ332]|nr:hypothetical protein FO519_008846 [Halicephalobus sp. NKZ332]
MTEYVPGYTEWQAFQMYIYNNVDNPYCTEVFQETFENTTELGFPLSLGFSPSMCQMPPGADRINITVNVVITAPDAEGLKIRALCDTQNDVMIQFGNSSISTGQDRMIVTRHERGTKEMTFYYSSTNLFPPDDLHFQLILTVSPPVIGSPTICSFTNISAHSWQFSYYDPINGYQNNAHCVKTIAPTPGYRLFFIFDNSWLEDPFDMVLLQSVLSSQMIQLHDYDAAIAPEAMAVLEFQSDANIAYSGFTLNITEYNCACSHTIVTVPCVDTITKYYSDDLSDERALCNSLCSFNVVVNNTCSNSKSYVMLIPPSQNTTDGQPNYTNFQVHFNNQLVSLMKAPMFVFKAKDPFFFKYQNYDIASGPVYTTNQSFKIVMSAIRQPMFMGSIVYPFILFVMYDLHKLKSNTFLQILGNTGNKSKIFFVAEDPSYFKYFDIYTNDGLFIVNCADLQPGGIRKFMPRGFISDYKVYIYVEQQINQLPAFAYFWFPGNEPGSCMFQHNIIDASLIVDTDETVAMVNNGTGYCNVTILNAMTESIVMKELWTDSKDDPVIFYMENTLSFEFTKYTAASFENWQLGIGSQYFSVPSGKSFTVLLYRSNSTL